MHGSQPVLDPLDGHDLSHLRHWIDSDEDLFTWSGARFRAPLDEAQLREHAVAATAPESGIRAFRARRPSSGEPAGHVELTGLLPGHTSCALRRMIVNPALRRQGLGTAIVDQVLEVAFDDLELHRVEVRVFDDNLAGLHLYRRCGFTVEGRLREYRRLGDRFRSAYVLGLLEPEWRAHRGRSRRSPATGAASAAASR